MYVHPGTLKHFMYPYRLRGPRAVGHYMYMYPMRGVSSDTCEGSDVMNATYLQKVSFVTNF